MQSERTWTEWFTSHIRSAPFQIHHMRELAETTVSATDTAAVRVSGSTDQARLPYRVDPADDADLLYVNLLNFARWVAERVGGASPRALRERMWRGPAEPQGLPVCTPHEAYLLAAEITRWLESCAHQIAHDSELHDAPDALVEVVRETRRRYPRAEPKFRAYRPRPCPTCHEATVRPTWDADGLSGAVCDTCGQMWQRVSA